MESQPVQAEGASSLGLWVGQVGLTSQGLCRGHAGGGERERLTRECQAQAECPRRTVGQKPRLFWGKGRTREDVAGRWSGGRDGS